MNYVTVALGAALIAWALGSTIAWSRIVSSERRQHARDRELLVNQLLHLAGRTWSPPPAASNGRTEAPPALSYTAHPETLDWEAPE